MKEKSVFEKILAFKKNNNVRDTDASNLWIITKNAFFYFILFYKGHNLKEHS